ncbi:MAG: hypothetical protein WCG27_09515, partial [Pseudomonadota bacterium]
VISKWSPRPLLGRGRTTNDKNDPHSFLFAYDTKSEQIVGFPTSIKDRKNPLTPAQVAEYLRSYKRPNILTTIEELPGTLRKKTYSLTPITPPVNPSAVREELEQLAANGGLIITTEVDAKLEGLPGETAAAKEQRQVFLAKASDIPQTMVEIGRLREMELRKTGAGSGKPHLVDQYDKNRKGDIYWQVIVYDPKRQKIAGVIRFGEIDKIIQRYGVDHILSTKLFEFDALLESAPIEKTIFTDDPVLGDLTEKVMPGFLDRNSLDVDCPYIASEYRHGKTIYLLWKAIALFVSTHPQYSKIIGTLGISSNYLTTSRSILLRFLMRHHRSPFSVMVRPAEPIRYDPTVNLQELEALTQVPDPKLLQYAFNLVETDGRAISPLVNFHLELGVQFLEVSRNLELESDSGLMILDLLAPPTERLQEIFTREQFEILRRYHGVTP